MQITNINEFLDYYSKIKDRTERLFNYIPEEKIEWTYKTGKFTIGDLIRHLANIERYMFAENVQFKESKYSGCGKEYALGLVNVIEYYKNKKKESIEMLSKLTDGNLRKKCLTPSGVEISIWKWLRAMLEHEIHHRGQLYLYLVMLDVKTPPIFGLTSEEVIRNSIK
ncbi:DinB family protein [Aquimarina sp. AU119]|uniref:DinB family protein n=1 Tax=Aquimarina sp. AU119 TaxID=2108528 RepID=UPI000D698082|nr:DinB family protein [Aquimarina sp. AU119]